jgi:hypothetical protein
LEPTHHNQINTISCFTKGGAIDDHDHVDDDYFKKTSKRLYLNKKEKLKQFTISVFVDSFEDYSFNKTNSDTSSSTINNNNSINVQSPKENNHYQYMEQPLVDDGNSSLKEFELNEARTIISTANTCNTSRNQSIINIEHENLNDIANKKKPTFQATRIYDDDVFMFESRPNNFGLWMNNNASVLASKPPLMPVQNDTNKNLSTDVNTNNALLSTIIEGSVETFETCSNQSRDRLDDVANSDSGVVEIGPNVTVRKEASINKYKSDSNSVQEEEEGKDKAALKSLTEILHNLDDNPSNENERDSFFKADTNELTKNFG